MKFFVGLVGVGLVLLAVVASIGLLSYMGVAGSLIILEVVPFLVLAVGVDNLFIIVHSYEVSTHAHLLGPWFHILILRVLSAFFVGEISASIITVLMP